MAGRFNPRMVVLHDWGHEPDQPTPSVDTVRRTIPYHVGVMPDGTVVYRNPDDKYGSPAPHAFGLNDRSIGLAYVAPVGATPTPAAMKALQQEREKIRAQYGDLEEVGHGEAYQQWLNGRDIPRPTKTSREMQEASWRNRVGEMSQTPEGGLAPLSLAGVAAALYGNEPTPAAPAAVASRDASPVTYPQHADRFAAAAAKYGLDPALLHAFARVESSGNPRNTTGQYKGLFQLSDSEFARHGGQGNIYDADQNTEAAARKLRSESDAFANKYGRQPTAGELYMIHNQGVGGSAAHWDNPDAPAWENMYGTMEGRARGPGWAQQAIWGNLTPEARAKFGSVENVSSRAFTDFWNDRVGGSSAPKVDPYQYADATPENSPQLASGGQTPSAAPSPALTAQAPSVASPGASRATPSDTSTTAEPDPYDIAKQLFQEAAEQKERDASPIQQIAAMQLTPPQVRKPNLGRLRAALNRRMV